MSKGEKQIHVRIPEDLHRQLRVRCAYDGVTMQDYVVQVLHKALSEEQFAENLANRRASGDKN